MATTPPSYKPEIFRVEDVSVERDGADIEQSSQIHLIDSIRVLGLSDDDADFYNSYTTAQRNRVTRKVSFIKAISPTRSLSDYLYRSTFASSRCSLCSI